MNEYLGYVIIKRIYSIYNKQNNALIVDKNGFYFFYNSIINIKYAKLLKKKR